MDCLLWGLSKVLMHRNDCFCNYGASSFWSTGRHVTRLKQKLSCSVKTLQSRHWHRSCTGTALVEKDDVNMWSCAESRAKKPQAHFCLRKVHRIADPLWPLLLWPIHTPHIVSYCRSCWIAWVATKVPGVSEKFTHNNCTVCYDTEMTRTGPRIQLSQWTCLVACVPSVCVCVCCCQ